MKDNTLSLKYDKISNLLWELWHLNNYKYNDRLFAFLNKLKKKSVILDLGCGFGRDVYFFNQNGFDAYGIDFSKKMIELGKEKYGKINLIYGDILKASSYFNFKFDAIRCRGVLFHMDKDEFKNVINEIFKLTSSNSKLYIQINKNISFYKYRSIAGSDQYSHYYFYNKEFISKILLDYNFYLDLDISTSNYICLIYVRK